MLDQTGFVSASSQASLQDLTYGFWLAAKATLSEQLQQRSEVKATGGYAVISTNTSSQQDLLQTTLAKSGNCNIMNNTE